MLGVELELPARPHLPDLDHGAARFVAQGLHVQATEAGEELVQLAQESPEGLLRLVELVVAELVERFGQQGEAPVELALRRRPGRAGHALERILELDEAPVIEQGHRRPEGLVHSSMLH